MIKLSQLTIRYTDGTCLRIEGVEEATYRTLATELNRYLRYRYFHRHHVILITGDKASIAVTLKGIAYLIYADEVKNND